MQKARYCKSVGCNSCDLEYTLWCFVGAAQSVREKKLVFVLVSVGLLAFGLVCVREGGGYVPLNILVRFVYCDYIIWAR